MNGMADSILRGLGVQGAAVATIKNMIINIISCWIFSALCF